MFVGLALIFFLADICMVIISENITLTFTTHQTHLTKSNAHTSDSLGDTSHISVRGE